MGEVIVPRQEVSNLIHWGFNHPKFEPNDHVHTMDEPAFYTLETVSINRARNLIFHVNSAADSEIKYISGAVTLERRPSYDPYGVMSMTIARKDGASPWVAGFKVNETPDRSNFILEQTERPNQGDPFMPVEPSLDTFLGHLATVTSATDFDWSAHEDAARSYSNRHAA